MALMHDYIRQANFNTKPHLQGKFSALALFVCGYSFQIYYLRDSFMQNFTTYGNNFKTRLGGEICSFDVNTRKGYFLGTPPIIICTCTAVYSHEAHFHMLIPCDLF